MHVSSECEDEVGGPLITKPAQPSGVLCDGKSAVAAMTTGTVLARRAHTLRNGKLAAAARAIQVARPTFS